MAILISNNSDVNVLEIAAKVLKSNELKVNVAEIIENYEVSEDVAGLEKSYGESVGRVNAMKDVLMDTNSERYARFMCFVCMDSTIDTFLDSCAHVICERCWRKGKSSTCPGCRAEVTSAKHIFTLS